ncbi:MAG: type II toxin-antitoxin system RelE/ParE family toxin [Desulfobacteraceae bacterium]|jgi:phage-related protein
MKTIIFYKTISGKCPVEEFLDSLTSKQAQKTAWVLSIIEELPSVPVKYFKKLVNTDDLWEVRINYANDIFRLLGFLDGPKLIILNHAFQKKTQKTPLRDIKTAEDRKNEYFQRRSK